MANMTGPRGEWTTETPNTGRNRFIRRVDNQDCHRSHTGIDVQHSGYADLFYCTHGISTHGPVDLVQLDDMRNMVLA